MADQHCSCVTNICFSSFIQENLLHSSDDENRQSVLRNSLQWDFAHLIRDISRLVFELPDKPLRCKISHLKNIEYSRKHTTDSFLRHINCSNGQFTLLIFQAGFLLLPIGISIFLLRSRHCLHEYKQRFGILFEEFKTSNVLALVFQAVFILRRCLFCLILVLGRKNGALQSSYFYGLNLLAVLYSATVRPYQRLMANVLNLFGDGGKSFYKNW